MSRTFASNADHLRRTAVPVSNYPVTMACWFRSTDLANAQFLVGIEDGTSSDWIGIYAAGDTANDPVLAQSRNNSSGSANAFSTTGYTSGVWYHACGVFASATSRAAYINGGSKGTNTDNITPASQARVVVGLRVGDSFGVVGRVAEATIWNVALSDGEVAALGKGVPSRFIRRSAIKAYWPIFGKGSPEPDLSGNGYHLTVTGTTQSDHAPVGPQFGMDYGRLAATIFAGVPLPGLALFDDIEATEVRVMGG